MQMKRNLLAGLLLILSISVHSAELVGKVIKVTDGDTITILDANNEKFKVRLSGIDAPEKKQAFGKASKQSLADLVAGKIVTVDYNKRDRYKRIIGKVKHENRDVNLEQVKRGLAWHYKKYEGEQYVEDRALYAHQEYLALRNKIGLWADDKSIAPWTYRKNKKRSK